MRCCPKAKRQTINHENTQDIKQQKAPPRNNPCLLYTSASDEALVRSAAAKAEKFLSEEAPDTTTLDGPTPSVEDIVLAAGTISFFGGRRLVILPLIRPSAYSDKDLQELCDTLSDTENAVFVLTSLLEEKYGKIKPGKREQKLIAACEKLGYCVPVSYTHLDVYKRQLLGAWLRSVRPLQ